MAAVLSGNRNFEGRVNPLVKANYLASPPLVVAYALAGRVDIDLHERAARQRISDGKPVYLRDIWPTTEEVRSRRSQPSVKREMFAQAVRAKCSKATRSGSRFTVPTGRSIRWDDNSTYIKKPPYFDDMVDPATSVTDLHGLRVLAVLGDSVTTDHISPAGNIAEDSPGRTVSDRAGRAAGRLQLLRRAARQS